jgi:hypothetical protein
MAMAMAMMLSGIYGGLRRFPLFIWVYFSFVFGLFLWVSFVSYVPTYQQF